MNARASASSSPWTYFSLVFILSVPFWLIGAMSGRLLQREIPINLPVSALMTFNPLIAASILVHRESGWGGVKALLKRTVDYRKIEGKIWYVPIFLFWPAAMVLAYGIMRSMGAPLPHPRIPMLMVPVFFVVFLLAAAGEELGWQGYLIDRMQGRWSALEASIIVGAVWATWHMVPFVESHHTPTWIAWQCLGMIPYRTLVVWLYANTKKSVFAAISFHDAANVSQFLFPNYGSHYDPFITGLILAFSAAMVTFVWGPETLARNRYARPSGANPMPH